MKLTFKNSVGTVTLGNDETFKITAINGLYIPDKTYNTINFAGFDGQLTYSWNANARIITIGGDVISKNVCNELENAMRVFDEGGELILDFGEKKRKIICNQVSFSVSDRTTVSAVFTLQFVCDYPYFTDVVKTVNGLYGSNGCLKNPITLPCVFSTRDNTACIFNKGDKKTFPIFNINVISKGTSSSDTDFGYKIINNTTNQQIYLKHISSAGEKIIVDIENRTIVSSLDNSIISEISDDTYLDDFWLIPGNNNMEVVDLGVGDVSRISIEFENYYVEAVY